MRRLGTHLLIDAWEAPVALIDDPEAVRSALVGAVEAGGATVIDVCVHHFSPHGVTATVTLAESHAAVHTWPEYGYAAVDYFSCSALDWKAAMRHLEEQLGAESVHLEEVERGVLAPAAEGRRATLVAPQGGEEIPLRWREEAI